MKQKKEKFPYKIIRPEQVDELRTKPTEELHKEYFEQNKKAQIVKRQKRDDAKLKELKDAVKKHRDSSQELKDAKDELKAVRESVDAEIEEDILDKKALEGGYRDEIKGFNEMAHAIQNILDKRSRI
jgi:hypothetical protein